VVVVVAGDSEAMGVCICRSFTASVGDDGWGVCCSLLTRRGAAAAVASVFSSGRSIIAKVGAGDREVLV